MIDVPLSNFLSKKSRVEKTALKTAQHLCHVKFGNTYMGSPNLLRASPSDSCSSSTPYLCLLDFFSVVGSTSSLFGASGLTLATIVTGWYTSAPSDCAASVSLVFS